MTEKSFTIGKLVGWLAILAALIGLFWQPYIMGGAAIVLAIIGFFLKADTNSMNITAIVLGLIAMLIGYISY